jgi:hypothetical protein
MHLLAAVDTPGTPQHRVWQLDRELHTVVEKMTLELEELQTAVEEEMKLKREELQTAVEEMAELAGLPVAERPGDQGKKEVEEQLPGKPLKSVNLWI